MTVGLTVAQHAVAPKVEAKSFALTIVPVMRPTRSNNTPDNLASGKRKTVQSRRTTIVVESNIPPIPSVLPWERELLLPIVERLLDDVLAGFEQAET